MFDWIPLYEEIARKLLEFEHRQAELLDLVRQIRAKGIPVVSLKDKSGAGEVELAEIDPFTFFACFNRQTVADNRRAILQELKQAWNLAAPIPSDFEGIPVVNNQQSWFFPYLTRRGKDDISKLWQLARETVEKTAETFDWQLLQNCIAIKAVNLPKLTMGMFLDEARSIPRRRQQEQTILKEASDSFAHGCPYILAIPEGRNVQSWA